MNNKLRLAIASALLLSGSLAYAADSIVFDANGTAAGVGDQSIGGFDWAVSSSMANDAIPLVGSSTFQAYSHAALQGFTNTAGNPSGAPAGLNSTYEITFIGGFREASTVTPSTSVNFGANGVAGGGDDIITVSSAANFVEATGGNNFFRVYYDNNTATFADNLSGDGFNNGTLILEGSVVDLSGNFSSTLLRFTDVDSSGSFTAADTVDTTAWQTYDQFNGDSYGGQRTVVGNGSTQLGVNVTFQNNDFFKTNITQLVMDLFFNTSNLLPFLQTNPSADFDNGSGGKVLVDLSGTTFQGRNVGSVNGLTGPDIGFQTDANNSFAVAVPEPGILALLGIGLGFMGFNTSKRRSFAGKSV